MNTPSGQGIPGYRIDGPHDRGLGLFNRDDLLSAAGEFIDHGIGDRCFDTVFGAAIDQHIDRNPFDAAGQFTRSGQMITTSGKRGQAECRNEAVDNPGVPPCGVHPTNVC